MPKQFVWVRRRRILGLCRDTIDVRLKTGLSLVNLLLAQQASFSEQLFHSGKGTTCFPVLKFRLSPISEVIVVVWPSVLKPAIRLEFNK